MRAVQIELIQAIAEAFPPRPVPCPMTLLQGDEEDTYYEIKTLDDVAPLDWQSVTDEQLETLQWGMGYLDPDSWLFYLPAFMRYAISYPARNSLVIDRFFDTLIPRDWKPDQFKQLTDKQRAMIVAALEFLIYDDESQESEEANAVYYDHWGGKAASEQG